MFLRACTFSVGLIDIEAHQLPHIGHIIPIAAIRLSHIGLAIGIQILSERRNRNALLASAAKRHRRPDFCCGRPFQVQKISV